MITDQAFAEIIESSLDYFIAQSWQSDNFPRFGSLVCVSTDLYTIVGCVTQIQTGSMDPSRYPFPYQKTEAQLKTEQPQIFAFLKTTFRVQMIGYLDHKSSTPFFLLPPTPCKIHAFVFHASQAIQKQFLAGSSFLHLLFSFANNVPNLDELLLAILRTTPRSNKKEEQLFLRDFCHKFSMLTRSDYRRLKVFLERVQQIT